MKRLLFTAMFLGALIVPAYAQEPGDEPEHGVARLSVVSGDVAVRRGDSGEEIAGELNAPLVTRDHVLTDRGARAEIQLDWANIIRLAPESEVRMARLSDRDFRVEFAAGTMTFRVLRDSNAQVEISTPTASIRPTRKGTYRIVVRDDFSTEITVRSGDTDVFVGREFSSLRSGQTLLVRGDPANPARTFASFLPYDDWDRWNESRDRDLERSESYKYVSRDIYGADDLDGHGRWVYDAPYGWVWAPTVASTWAPYRVGRWYWADHYGWTWVSGDPWGWAPYHYGRWYQAPRHGWVWHPGPPASRYYWRPALVSFFGWGVNVGSVNVNFGFGNVGWVPLAPYEPYRPWYGRNVTVVNVINNVNVVNGYRNARYVNGRSGVTGVFANDFGRRHITVNNFVSAQEWELHRAGDVRGRVPFEPSRESHRLSERQNDRQNDRVPERVFVSRPNNSDRSDRDRAFQPRLEPRPEPRQPAQPDRTNRPPDRDRTPPARVEVRPEPARPIPLPNPTLPPSRREDRDPASVRGNPSRGLDRAVEAGRRPEREERQQPQQQPNRGRGENSGRGRR
jgi:hypothetical protein